MLNKLMSLFFLLFLNVIMAQKTVQTFHRQDITEKKIAELKNQFSNNKTILKDFEAQSLIALSYFPELKNTKIKFKLKNRTTPLTSRPSFFSMFRGAKKRTYVITISNQSTPYLNLILLKNLNFNAQIGVLGHELCHISDYIHKGFGKMSRIGSDMVFSKKRIDVLEYNTDLCCINHGLGYQLLDWSTSVREILKSEKWFGASNLAQENGNERYMNPTTIIEYIENNPLYKDDK